MTIINMMLNTPKYLNTEGCFIAECPTLPVTAAEFEMCRKKRDLFDLFKCATDGMR